MGSRWAGQWEAGNGLCPHTPLDINYTCWNSAWSFKTSVRDQAWHYFNSLNCGSDACLDTLLTGKFTKCVSLFSRL